MTIINNYIVLITDNMIAEIDRNMFPNKQLFDFDVIIIVSLKRKRF